MSSDADELQARIDKLSSDPNANVGPGSEIERLKRQLPYANTQPPKPSICDRVYGNGAYTAIMINEVACCTSCGQPIKEHKHA